jgi:hypothetical protein
LRAKGILQKYNNYDRMKDKPARASNATTLHNIPVIVKIYSTKSIF